MDFPTANNYFSRALTAISADSPMTEKQQKEYESSIQLMRELDRKNSQLENNSLPHISSDQLTKTLPEQVTSTPDIVVRLSLDGIKTISKEQYEHEQQPQVVISGGLLESGLLSYAERATRGERLLDGREDVGTRVVLAGAKVNGDFASEEQLLNTAKLMTNQSIELDQMFSELGVFEEGFTEAGVYGQLRAGGADHYVQSNADGSYKPLGFYMFEGVKREYSMGMEFTTESGKTVTVSLNMQEKVVEEGNFLNQDAPGAIRRYMDADITSSEPLTEAEAGELQSLLASSNNLFNDYFDTFRIEQVDVDSLQQDINSSELFSEVSAEFSRDMYYSFGDHTMNGYVSADTDQTKNMTRHPDNRLVTIDITNNSASLKNHSTTAPTIEELNQVALGKTFLGDVREL